MLYLREIWAFNDTDDLVEIQLQFVKQVYSICKNTPNAFVRAEFDILPVKTIIFKFVLSLVVKILLMPAHRLPSTSICYNSMACKSNS